MIRMLLDFTIISGAVLIEDGMVAGAAQSTTLHAAE